MKDSTKRVLLTIALIALIQYIPMFALIALEHLINGIMPGFFSSGIGAILTGVFCIVFRSIRKLKAHIYPKVLTIFAILDIAGGLLYLILGVLI